jgi:hypothetical protein
MTFVPIMTKGIAIQNAALLPPSLRKSPSVPDKIHTLWLCMRNKKTLFSVAIPFR